MVDLLDFTQSMYATFFETNKRFTGSTEKHSIHTAFNRVRRLPMRVAAFHARDLYPFTFREILLVKLVTTFEAFLFDTFLEAAPRNVMCLSELGRVQISAGQLLTLTLDNSLLDHLVRRTARPITSGGLVEAAKLYKKILKIDFWALPGLSAKKKQIEEIHLRRNIVVHRDGYPDDLYLRQSPSAPLLPNGKIDVSTDFLHDSSAALLEFATKLDNAVDSTFPPGPVAWTKLLGTVTTYAGQDAILVFGRVARGISAAGMVDMNSDIDQGVKLQDIAVYGSHKGDDFRLLLKGTRDTVRRKLKQLHLARRDNIIVELTTIGV